MDVANRAQPRSRVVGEKFHLSISTLRPAPSILAVTSDVRSLESLTQALRKYVSVAVAACADIAPLVAKVVHFDAVLLLGDVVGEARDRCLHGIGAPRFCASRVVLMDVVDPRIAAWHAARELSAFVGPERGEDQATELHRWSRVGALPGRP